MKPVIFHCTGCGLEVHGETSRLLRRCLACRIVDRLTAWR